MDHPILVVEDSFYISGRGTVVEPPLSPDTVGATKSGHVAHVRLVQPDGTEEVVEATFSWTHFNPGGYRFVCYLLKVKKEQAPPGTQIWLCNGNQRGAPASGSG